MEVVDPDATLKTEWISFTSIEDRVPSTARERRREEYQGRLLRSLPAAGEDKF